MTAEPLTRTWKSIDGSWPQWLYNGTDYTSVDLARASDKLVSFEFDYRKPPLYLSANGDGSYAVVSINEARYVWLATADAQYEHGFYNVNFFGSLASTLAIPGDGVTLFYYDVDSVGVPHAAELLVVMAQYYRGDLTYNRSAFFDNCNVFGPVTTVRTPNFTVDDLSELPRPKISAAYHTHFRPDEVYASLDAAARTRAQLALCLPRDAIAAFVAGVMLWLASLDDWLYAAVAASDLWCAEDTVSWAKRAKRISVAAKGLQNLHPKDLRKVFEIEVLVNRGIGSVSWADERSHRIRPDVVTIDPDVIYKEALYMFAAPDAAASQPRSLDWQSFWQSRWQWSAAGSIHTQYREDRDYVDPRQHLKNKFITLTAMPSTPLRYFTRRRPAVEAWSSTKYEWGKMRAIYGTDLTSYVLTHFVFYNVEDTLPSHFPVGKKARPSFVNARLSAVLRDVLPFCIDFEDFNSQHSIPAMQAVLRAYADAKGRASWTSDQLEAFDWVYASIADMTVHDFSGLGMTYKSRGTLLSGWRLTTFINSVLNYVYTKVIAGTTKAVLRSVHNGDDAILGLTCFGDALRMRRLAAAYNVRLQTSKSYYGAIAEFLRVDHLRGSHGQYLTRGVSTLIHSRIEGRPASNLRDVVESMEERLTEFAIRGGDMDTIVRLRDTYYKYITPLFQMNVDDAYVIKSTHRVNGGVTALKRSRIDKIVSLAVRRQPAELPSSLPGIRDYAVAVCRSLDIMDALPGAITNIRNATANAVEHSYKSLYIINNTDVRKSTILRALHKSYADVADVATFGKAKMVGVLLDVMSGHGSLATLAGYLAAEPDPLMMLRVIT